MQIKFFFPSRWSLQFVCLYNMSDFIQDGDAGSHFTVNRPHEISLCFALVPVKDLSAEASTILFPKIHVIGLLVIM